VWLRHSSYCALETTVFVFDVEGIAPGIYDYDIRQHQLVLRKAGLFRAELGKLCIGQMHAGKGAAAFVVSAVWARYMKRYPHARAYRNLFINTAELVHKYIIAATAFRLSNFITPAIDDEFAADLLNIESFEQAPLYMAAVG
jgi:SagB-type dehydrogenase family enzyme